MKKSLETIAAHDVHDSRHHGAVVFPIYQNSLFTYERHGAKGHDFSYSRGDNPTVQVLEERLAALEGGEKARCFGSGMAAITAAIFANVQQGDHAVCIKQAYGGTKYIVQTYLAKFGVEATFVDGVSVEEIEAVLKPNTKILYLESPSSYMFGMQDIKKCTELARSRGIITIIDNTWSTPYYQQPIALGVDLVVHSLTKYMGGHSDAIGGVVIGSEKAIKQISDIEFTVMGGIMSPHTANLIMRGLRTLPLRLKHANEAGRAVAAYLETKPNIKVHYPGLASHPQYEIGKAQMTGYGSLMSFETEASIERMQEWADHLQYFRIGCSWGGFDSLALVLGSTLAHGGHADTTLVRLYCGLEAIDDLIQDLEQAFIACPPVV